MGLPLLGRTLTPVRNNPLACIVILLALCRPADAVFECSGAPSPHHSFYGEGEIIFNYLETSSLIMDDCRADARLLNTRMIGNSFSCSGMRFAVPAAPFPPPLIIALPPRRHRPWVRV